MRRGCREEDDWRSFDKQSYERLCSTCREMLSHLKGAGKVNASAKIRHFFKIKREETVLWNFQHTPWNVIAIDPKIIAYTAPLEFFKPAAHSAPDIYNRAAGKQR